MRYNIKGKNMQVGDRTKEKIEEKFARIEKLFPQETVATVLLSKEKLETRMEVTIPMKKRVIRAEVSESSMIEAMDKALDILENQYVRYKNRLRTKMRQKADVYRAEYDSVLIPEESLGDFDEDSPIKKVKHFELKPMDAEEAVMEMDLLGHSFFVFRNGDTDNINVVYRRKDGSFGLIEPEY
jgi:putative sigma-54 modulation protein